MQKENKKRKAANQIFQERVQLANMECQNEMDSDEMDLFSNALPSQSPQQQQNMSSSLKPRPKPKPKPPQVNVAVQQISSEELQQDSTITIRETGWLWRTVVVPPNAYVVHTRRGRKEPVTIGLGSSFRYRPHTDSYLVAPSAMQTIGIIAEGISREKQGIKILAYVQWMISDFTIAYQRLDFSNPKDPMGVVSAQLSEQAEAAIKDKISTMSVEEILTDKAPIIEELTQRMKKVAEGDKQGIGGLGVKIVTVQIKEAYVSSQKLWEDIQAPFRDEREREARLSRLRIEEEVKQQELQNQKKIKHAEAQTQTEIQKFEAQKQTESLDVVTKERISRKELENQEQETEIFLNENTVLKELSSQHKLEEQRQKDAQELKLQALRREQQVAIENSKLEQQRYLEHKTIEIEGKVKELELTEKLLEYEHQLKLKERERKEFFFKKEFEDRLNATKNKLALEKLQKEHDMLLVKQEFEMEKQQQQENDKLQHERMQKKLEFARTEQEIKNIISDGDLHRLFIEKLPELAESMPDVNELKMVQFGTEGELGGADLLTTYVSKIMTLFEHFRSQKQNDKIES